jgi:large subunit ribosomal protein L17
MLNNMATSVLEKGKVRTTLPKAKELRGVVERLITFAKRGDLHARRQVLRRIQNKVVVSKLFEEIGPSFEDRTGGYTRILKLGPRRGDSSELCLVELVGDEVRSDYAESGAETQAVATEPEVEETPTDTVAAEEEAVETVEEASEEETVEEETQVEASAETADAEDETEESDEGDKKDA